MLDISRKISNFVTDFACFTMDKIDSLDRKILKIVIGNARIPSKDVALA